MGGCDLIIISLIVIVGVVLVSGFLVVVVVVVHFVVFVIIVVDPFVGLGSCDNVQTETLIFKYANCPNLKIERTGPSSWSVQLVCSAGPSSRSIHLVCPAGPSSWSVQPVHSAGQTSKLHVLQSAHVAKSRCCKGQKKGVKQWKLYTFNFTHCTLPIASDTLHKSP